MRRASQPEPARRTPPPSIAWCHAPARTAELVEFFVANTDPSYISHGEIQDGRAPDFARWSPRLAEVLAEEFGDALGAGGRRAIGNRIAIARGGARLIALALVSVRGAGARGRFAILQDLVVARDARSAGVGRLMLGWIERSLTRRGVTRIFLESGARNAGAHAFFERAGYAPCSVIMHKPLRRRGR